MTKYKKCVACDEYIKENMQDYRQYLTYTDKGKPIHETCKSDDEIEPILQVVPIGNNPDFEDLEYSGYGLTAFNVGYYHDMTDGLFSFYGKYDNWRGGDQPTSKTYTEIETNHITVGYGNDDDLEQQKNKIFKIVQENNLRAVYIASRTSNCLSLGLGYWIHKDDLDKYNKAIQSETINNQ